MVCNEAFEYPKIWVWILQFYFKYVRSFGKIHPDLPSGAFLAKLDDPSTPFPKEFAVGASFAHEFNEAYEALKHKIAASLREPDAERIWQACFAVRALQCFIVWTSGATLGLLAGLLQFVVAPLSLTSSFIRLFTNFSDCLIHYALNFAAILLLAPILPYVRRLPITTTFAISPLFVVAFFVIDFFLNLLVYVRTAERWTATRLLKHIVYGTFNTKTYFVVVLGCLYELEFDIVVVVATSIMAKYFMEWGFQSKLLNFLGWPNFCITFYVEHRIGHMPRVYQHAHKMHHYLHDSTAFDAHIYGSGLNEEFFWILAETLPCLLFPNSGVFPYWMNLIVLYISWTNKGAHSRTASSVTTDTFGCFDEDNFHADHHTWHRANFGSSTAPFIDFYFGTACPGLKGANGVVYDFYADADDKDKLWVRLSKPSNREQECRSVQDAATTNKEDDGSVVLVGKARALEQGPHEAEVAEDPSRRSISRAELAVHKEGPWVAIHGGVFDLSSFKTIHPGGAEVLKMYGGTDATKPFDEVGHSQKAKLMGKRRLVGLLDGSPPTGFVQEWLSSPQH
mmetsp:Transcript_23754/g.51896  ORF Transcript_23754/g.51896 Transcript_23754/m.51896 type:complete len:565 (+) Transcript_23754:53-1747(+)